MPFCQYCGSQLGETDKFCSVCGKLSFSQNPGYGSFPPQTYQNNNNYQRGDAIVFQQNGPQVFQQPQVQPGFQHSPGQNYQHPITQPAQHQYGSPMSMQPGYPQYPNLGNLQNAFVPYIDNPFDQQVFEIIKSLNWLDPDPPNKDAIFCMVNELPFSYQLKDSKGSTPDYFVLQLNVTDFKNHKLEEILRLTQEINSYLLTSKAYATSPKINSDDDINSIQLLYCIKKHLIRDIKETLEEAVNELRMIAVNILENI